MSNPMTETANFQSTFNSIDSFSSDVVNAPQNSVIYVYPDTSGTKPVATFPASYTDWTAMGIPIGVAQNGQYETLDTVTGSPISINPVTGQPGVNHKVIVVVGGVLVNSIIHYVEVNSTYGGAQISPVYFQATGTDYEFIVRSTGIPCTGCTQSKTAPNSQDLFVIYTVIDGNGNTYYVLEGMHWRGTLAAAYKLLALVQSGSLSSQTFSYEVWRWTDSNGNGIPDSGDTYTQIDSG
jgi:hypothetical protein